jgi:outer membrane protein insertion porin family
MPSSNPQDKSTMNKRDQRRIRFASTLLASLGILTSLGSFACAQTVGPGYGYSYSPAAPNTNGGPATGPASGYGVGAPYGVGGAYGGTPANSAPPTVAPTYYDPATGAPINAAPGYGGQAYAGPANGGQAYVAPVPNAAVNGGMLVGQPMFGQAVPGQVVPGQVVPGQVVQGQPMMVQPNTIPQNYNQPLPLPGPMNQPLPPLNQPWQIEPNTTFMDASPFGYNPRIRDVPINVYAQEGQTGRFSVGGSVNSDLGVAGQFVLEERNFDIRKFPSRPSDLLNGAFRGAGQNFRMELVPGNLVQRYTLNWTEPNLFGYSPFSLSVGGFYFTRIYRDWSEQRLGARMAVGYEVTPDLSVTTELRGEDVNISNPSTNANQALNQVLGSSDLYTGRIRIAHNTRDSPFLPTEGHLLELIYDQTFGEFDFPRGQINLSRYFLVRERADGSGRHTFTSSMRLGFTGSDTPLFENFFAGGFSTMRGFQFRGAGPVENGVQVGGQFQMLGSFEYMMPVTADDMLRMVAFVDYGTIEQNIEINSENFRVAPGIGARIAVPALGPAPLAFDFAFPVAYADTDSRQIFSFTMGLTR